MSNTPAIVYARAALSRGVLIREHMKPWRLVHYRFGRRLFRPDTINKLIAGGEAVRDGDVVRRT